jgi:hypothetical protein
MITKVKVRATKIPKDFSKLKLVRTIKYNTNLGLKEAKEWCDDICLPYMDQYKELDIVTDLVEFRSELSEHDFGFEVLDKQEERNLKLMLLGLSDKQDKIDLISNELSRNLERIVRIRSNESLHNIYFDFFTDFLLDLNDDKLEELINIKLKKIQKNG